MTTSKDSRENSPHSQTELMFKRIQMAIKALRIDRRDMRSPEKMEDIYTYILELPDRDQFFCEFDASRSGFDECFKECFDRVIAGK